MIPWVDDYCRDWAAHKRWLEYGEHGWPPMSMLGKLMEEGAGAGHGTFGSRILAKEDPPHYSTVNLALQRMQATRGMYTPWQVVHAHYVFGGKAKQKAPKLSLSLRQYWQQLHAAHAFISACNVPRVDESCARISACA
jgi:hypothetical protein